MKVLPHPNVLLVCLTLLIGGCGYSSPIEQYGSFSSTFSSPTKLNDHDYPEGDIYVIYHKAATGYVSIQSIRETAEERAKSFAANQGKGYVILGEQISSPPYILGNFPRIEFIFALIDLKDIEEPTNRLGKYEQLRQVKDLLDSGAITNDEYESEKQKILTK